MTLLLLTFGALFSIMNPLGAVPIFVGLTQGKTNAEKKRVALWASVNVFIIMLVSFFIGVYILQFFNISINSLKIAGGLLFTSSGFALLNGKYKEFKGIKKKSVQADMESRSDIALTPLAIPMIAGPGTISMLIAYAKMYTGLTNILLIIGAIILATVTVFIVLRGAQLITDFLGASGINALSRIIGFIVIAIGVEFITSAIVEIVKNQILA